MSASDNVAIVRESLERFLAGDIKWDGMHPKIEVRDFDIPDSGGTYIGHEGVLRWLEDWDSAWETTALEVAGFADHGDQVLATIDMTARGRSSGAETKRRNAMLYEVHDGLITKMDYYTTEEEANAAVEAYANQA